MARNMVQVQYLHVLDPGIPTGFPFFDIWDTFRVPIEF